MKILFLLPLFAAMITQAQQYELRSPNGKQYLQVLISTEGEISYELSYQGNKVIYPSNLSILLKEPKVLMNFFQVLDSRSSEKDDTWQTTWGEYASIRDNHRELRLKLKSRSGNDIRINLVFRLFNEGLGFRYEFPKEGSLDHFIVDGESSSFAMTGNHMAHWIPGDYDSNEFTYNHTRLSAIDANVSKGFTSIFSKTFFDPNAVQTPLMMKTDGGVYINIHEAALSNYPAMQLVLNKERNVFTSHLVPDAVGNRAYLQTPAQTPWRTIIVSSDAREVLSSNRMILNLNEPSKVLNTGFIKPQKFVGVWWEMHVGTGSWDYMSNGKPHGKHSANTENVKRYIDFAAKNGIQGVLVEGWNVGWEDWFGKWKEEVFDFVTPYPDYDLKAVTEYAKLKGVQIIMHHETSGSVTNYERRIDSAFRLMKEHGMNAVKTGYVGYIIPRGEHHDGQWMVQHYERVAKKGAEHGIMVDAHESVRLTGMHRTWPNWMASEAARGNEFNGWSEGNPPDHETILPFTRLMGGPMDYTPGIFEIKMSVYDSSKKNQVHTTLAKQLALYVTMYSPIQMAADLPENYEKRMDAFQFIKDVPVNWEDSKILLAEPGDFLAIARKERGGSNWYIGAITDEQKRTMSVPLDFLEAGAKYEATIYRDDKDAHWERNPMKYVIEKKKVDSKTVLKLMLAEGGGTAISIKKL